MQDTLTQQMDDMSLGAGNATQMAATKREVEANLKNEKWAALYNQEYAKQQEKFAGAKMVNMGQVFTEETLMEATLRQMKKMGVAQNMANWNKLSGMTNDDAKKVVAKLLCTPNCQHKEGNLEKLYDYSKSYKDAKKERPGECFLIRRPADAKECFGGKQTPINLDSSIPVTNEFTDSCFKFQYETIDPVYTHKFNQVNESYWFPLQNAKEPAAGKEDYNCMETSTISLFDKEIPSCNLYGKQFHFHAPSEHSVDGELMDLEMHIVHFMQQGLESQFFAGVLGFMFKIVPDQYFEERKVENPNILYHDQFLMNLVDEEKLRQESGAETEQSPLNLQRFVELVDFNRRFTYQGSLTTAPCAEGILWNVVEQVIPVRQQTLDEFVRFRQVQDSISTDYMVAEKAKETQNQFAEARDAFPENAKCQYVDNKQFMRVAMCSRKVQDVGDRTVYHIDKK